MNDPKPDLVRYMSDMKVIMSHLDAARDAASGIFMTNPLSRGVPAFADMAWQIQSIHQMADRGHTEAAEALIREFNIHCFCSNSTHSEEAKSDG